MTIAARNAGLPPVYFDPETYGRIRVRTNDGLAATPNTGILGSEDQLWGDAPVASAMLVPSLAFLYDEPFVSYNAAATTGDWVLTQATSGSAAISTTVPGALTLNSGASTQGQGANLQRLKTAFVPALTKNLWFEVTVKLGTSAANTQLFLGLAESNTAIISSGALNSINQIGWMCLTGGASAMQFTCTKASTSNTPAASPVTLSTTAAHRLGFFYDGAADTVQAYVDGAAVGSAIATTYIPKVVIYPSFVCQSDGTTQPTMTISALRCLQLR